MLRPRSWRFFGASVAALALSGLAAFPAAVAASSPSAANPTDWTTYGYDLQRTGSNPHESQITAATAGGLRQQWAARLNGVSDTSPLVTSGISVGGASKTLAYVGTEHGFLYAIDTSDGHVVWKRYLGKQQTRCSDLPGGVFGVTDTPVIDETAGLIYAVGGTGKLYALDLATGAVAAGYPVPLIGNPAKEHVWSALTLTGDSLYAATASYCDFRPYHGRLILVDVASRRVVTSFYPDGRTGPDGGAIWGWGGASVDPANGAVYVSTGNAFGRPEHARLAEHVVRLTPDLQVVAANYPGHLVGTDVDFGSTPTLYQVDGCPPQFAVENKSGVLFTYNRDAISMGPAQRLQVANVNDDEFDGMPAFSAADQMLYVSDSSNSSSAQYRHGMVAFHIGTDCRLSLAWQTTVGPRESVVSTPTVAGGVVYYGDGTGNRVFAFDAGTGRVLWTSGHTIGGPIFTAPSVSNGQLFVAAWDGMLHAYGLSH